MRLAAGVIALVGLGILGPVLPVAEATGENWTFLVYLDADNNLETWGIRDFEEMNDVGSTPELNIVVQFDRIPGDDSSNGDWTGARRYLVSQGMPPDITNTLPGGSLGEVNMADPQTLVDFVRWALGTPTSPGPYRAEHYFLDLWDHGLGWNGVIIDSSSSSDILTPAELAGALENITLLTGERIDILANDACRMTLEIMYEVRNYVDIFIGSEKDTPFAGWPYDALLREWTSDPTISPTELSVVLPDVYRTYYYDLYVNNPTQGFAVTMAAVSSNALGGVAANLTLFADELLSYFRYFSQEIRDARGRTEHYETNGGPGGDDYDLYHFSETVQEAVGSPRLTRLAAALRSSIEDAVLYERHWDNPQPFNQVRATHAHGLSIYFPSDPLPLEYRTLLSSLDTSWDEFVSAYRDYPRVERGLTASASTGDMDVNGLVDRIDVTAVPAVNGDVAVEVTGKDWDSTRVVPALAGERVLLVSVPPGPGWYGVAVYLFESGLLRNMTILPPVSIEVRRYLEGSVNAGGVPVTGSLTVRNARTGAEVTTAINNGRFNVSFVHPSWASEGDALELDVTATGQVTRFTFVPSWDSVVVNVSISLQAGQVLDTLSLLVGLVLGLVVAILLGVLLAFLRQRKRDRLLH